MGIEWNTLKFLLACHESGIPFTKTMTLGRQSLYVAPATIAQLLTANRLCPDSVTADLRGGIRHADKLFSLLGAEDIVSIDGSAFEGATIVHDMNEPLPKEHHTKYDVVFDGGTLEHVFHYTIALRSAMRAVRVGGHLLLHTPANNYCGHGFYQFSPELFYRALSPQNGFKIIRMIAFEAVPGATWYDVTDPETVRRRVEIAYAKQRILLLVLARRMSEDEIFKTAPQQSDYVAQWSGHDGGAAPAYNPPSLMARAIDLIRANPAIHTATSRFYASLKPRDQNLSIRNQPTVFHADPKR